MEKMTLSPKEVYEYVKGVGVKKTSNKSIQTLFLGIMAGMFIALGGFAAGAASHSITNYGLKKLVAGAVFPVGLMLVLVCGAELFTGNNLLTVAFIEKEISFKDLIKNWIIVFIGNFIGAVLISLLLYITGSFGGNEGLIGAYFIKVAAKKVSLGFLPALTSGILCNIVVCLAVWGSYAAKDVPGKVLMTFFPIMAFIIAGFEHCVANMFYLTAGLFSKMNPQIAAHFAEHPEKLAKIDAIHIINNLIPVTIGNIIGGGLIIGGVYCVIYSKKKSAVNKEKNIKA